MLELDRTTDRISGSLHDGTGPPRAFYGWLELSALLEQTLQSAPAGQQFQSPPRAQPQTP